MALRILAPALLLGVVTLARAEGGLTLQSPATRVTLLELYTSEGCSSCPPADRWLSGLAEDRRLWREVVPVAFHVDYWDYIGWKDELADPRFGERQRRLAAEGRIGSVYTPGLVLAGREWRGWFRRPVLDLGSAPTVGRLRLEVDADRVDVRFEPEARVDEPLEAHVALLGFDVETTVSAGENAGRRLHHDFVVLGYREASMARSDHGFTARLPKPTPRRAAARLAIAAWVNARGDLRPLQAVGGWLP